MGVMHPCHYPGCKKKFDRKYNLKCHLRIHSNEKPYRCHHQNCTRSFRWKSSLNHHLMSLDHTPAAVRRARKARAQRRRIPTTPPQTYLPQQQQQHQQPLFDLPTLSPVSSVNTTLSHSPSPQPHHFKLDHRLNPSHITASSSLPSTALTPQDVHLINTNNHPMYNHHTPSYRPPPTLHTQPYAPPKVQSHHQIIAHLQDNLLISAKPFQHPPIPEPPVKTEFRSFAEHPCQPTCPSEAETSIHTPADDISLLTPFKKSDLLDFNSSNKVPVPPPLVSIFEELSPASLMPFSSSLDSLFPANVEASGMKSF